MTLIPMVVEQDGRGERAYDIYSRLLKDRIVFLGNGDRRQCGQSDCRSNALSEAENPDKEIFLSEFTGRHCQCRDGHL